MTSQQGKTPTPRTDAACKRAAEIAAQSGTGALGMYGALQDSFQELELELAEALGRAERAEDGIRRIHQACKRGENTQDHGVEGNIACIIDHVLPDPPAIY